MIDQSHGAMKLKNQDLLDLADLTWLMAQLDVDDVLDRLGVRVHRRYGDEICAYCPTHMQFTGREPSHPKWFLNVQTGMCRCCTENRGSNLVFETSRILRLSAREAVNWLLGENANSLVNQLKRLQRLIDGFIPTKEVGLPDLAGFSRQLLAAELSEDGASFLAHAKSGAIRPSIARKYGLVDFKEGFYERRLIVPYHGIDGSLVGFEAVALETKEAWSTRTGRSADDFLKVRYPVGLRRGEILYGAHRFKHDDVAILVEGSRDTLKLRQEGFSGSLGLGGTNITDEQLLLLARLAPRRVIVFFDGDKAGYDTSVKVARKINEFFKGTIYIETTKDKDPKHLSRDEILRLFEEKAFYA